MAQHTCGLLTRGANAEVGASHDHIARAHARSEVAAHGFQAMPANHLQAVLHEAARGQHIGVDVGAQTPDAGVLDRAVHASTSRGSLMRPRSADAATV